MAYDLEPFASKLTPENGEPDTVVLLGDLIYSPELEMVFKHTAEEIYSNPRSQWTIQADDIRVVPGGERLWIEFVHGYLNEYELIYEPSQLTLILQYDEGYKHLKSVFKEY